MRSSYKQTLSEVYEGPGRDLANAANKAFDKRIETAENLAAVLNIIKDSANGWYDYTKSKDPTHDERLQDRKIELEQQVVAADQEFSTYELATAALMPSRGELDSLQTQVEATTS